MVLGPNSTLKMPVFPHARSPSSPSLGQVFGTHDRFMVGVGGAPHARLPSLHLPQTLTAKHTSFPSCSLSISLTSTVGWPFVPVLVEGWITSLFSRPAEGCEALEKGVCLGQRHKAEGQGLTWPFLWPWFAQWLLQPETVLVLL